MGTDKVPCLVARSTCDLADVNVAVLYLMAITSISVYGIVLAGWSSNNKYAMMGGLRSTAQMISYELALGWPSSVRSCWQASMSLVDIVETQGADRAGS